MATERSPRDSGCVGISPSATAGIEMTFFQRLQQFQSFQRFTDTPTAKSTALIKIKATPMIIITGSLSVSQMVSTEAETPAVLEKPKVKSPKTSEIAEEI